MMEYKSEKNSDRKLCPYNNYMVSKDDCNNCMFYCDCDIDWK